MNQIKLERDGAVLIGHIGNPPHGYMNDQTAEELSDLLDLAETDETIRAIILTGSLQDVFIRHYDVGILEQRGRELKQKGFVFNTQRPVPESIFLSSLRRMELTPKPFIAAINGTAMGGGFELALACDIRLAKSGNYKLGLPEINVGLLPGAGGTQRLPRVIGEAKTMEMIMLGSTYTPGRAEAMGVVSRCVEGDVLKEALLLAHSLSHKHPKALAHIKRLVRGATQRPSDEGLADERTLFCDLMVDETSLKLMEKMNSGKMDITGDDPS